MVKLSLKRILYSIGAFLAMGLGIALQIKAGIGQSMFNAFALSISVLITMKVGTVLNGLNGLFFILYLMTKRLKVTYLDAIQIAATLLNGLLINFYLYHVFHGWVLNGYPLKLTVFLVGLVLSSLSLGIVLAIGIINFPMERFCIQLTQIWKKELSTLRMGLDVFFLLGTLLVTFVFKQDLYIREGTVISFFLLSRLLGWSYTKAKHTFQ